MAARPDSIDIPTLRRFVVAHQGYGASRVAQLADVARVIDHLQAVQLDSITAVERAHRLTISSRVGTYPRDLDNRLLADEHAFEYWGHEACLVPLRDYPLYLRRMEEWAARHAADTSPEMDALEREVLDIVSAEGALPARAFAGENLKGVMWGWKPSKRALERLFARGELATARRDGFQRIYDLAERVIPRALREAPVPTEHAFVCEYAARAVEGRGALTARGVAEHSRIRGRAALIAQELESLVDEGRLRRLRVDDGGDDVFVPADAALNANPTAAVLLCPFDNLLWDRRFAPRLFGFQHIIEVYKPEPIREFGYYVLPLLVRDKIVARVDLRRDRAADALVVRTVHRERGQRDSKAFRAALDRALVRVASAAGVTDVSFARNVPR